MNAEQDILGFWRQAVSDASDETSEAAAETADAGSESSGEDDGARDSDNEEPSCQTGAAQAGGQSFTAGTMVLLADGRAVAISSLKPGQKVLATDTMTGKDQAETVTAVLVHHDRDLYDLKVRAGGRTAVIDTTSSHLFWDQDSRRWVKAAALKYGTHLRTPSGRTATVLGGHTPQNQSGWMWDLTIAPSHDFYIQTADTAVLVHNVDDSECGPAANGGLGDLVSVPKEDPAADALAERIGGVSRVRFANDSSGREFDAVSDEYVAQAKPKNSPLTKRSGIRQRRLSRLHSSQGGPRTFSSTESRARVS